MLQLTYNFLSLIWQLLFILCLVNLLFIILLFCVFSVCICHCACSKSWIFSSLAKFQWNGSEKNFRFSFKSQNYGINFCGLCFWIKALVCRCSSVKCHSFVCSTWVMPQIVNRFESLWCFMDGGSNIKQGHANADRVKMIQRFDSQQFGRRWRKYKSKCKYYKFICKLDVFRKTDDMYTENCSNCHK